MLIPETTDRLRGDHYARLMILEREHTPSNNTLIALVHLGDLLCRLRGLGYGYDEWRAIDLAADPAWHELATHCPKLANIDRARFTLDLDAYVVRITKMVDTIFSPVPALTG